MKLKRFRRVVDYGEDFGNGFNFWVSFVTTILLLPLTILFSLLYVWHNEWFKDRKVYFEEIK